MEDDRSFIQDIHLTLESALEVEDWITVKELFNEISDYLGLEDGNDYNDSDYDCS